MFTLTPTSMSVAACRAPVHKHYEPERFNEIVYDYRRLHERITSDIGFRAGLVALLEDPEHTSVFGDYVYREYPRDRGLFTPGTTLNQAIAEPRSREIVTEVLIGCLDDLYYPQKADPLTHPPVFNDRDIDVVGLGPHTYFATGGYSSHGDPTSTYRGLSILEHTGVFHRPFYTFTDTDTN